MSVIEWTVFQLMTDTAVLEKDKDNAVLLDIMRQLELKINAIIARESANA